MDPLSILLIIIVAIIFLYIGYLLGKKLAQLNLEKQIPEIRKKAIKSSRAILGGQFSEQLAPYLPDFKHQPTEARFIGKPIDFIIFQGMDNKEIEQVIFVEVKSGQSKLTPIEKKLKQAIEDKKVSWQEYRIPEELTKNKQQ